MEFSQTPRFEILGITVALVAIGAGATYFYFGKKPKGISLLGSSSSFVCVLVGKRLRSILFCGWFFFLVSLFVFLSSGLLAMELLGSQNFCG